MQPIVALLLTSFALAASTLCACKPAPPPEPRPSVGAPRPPAAAPAEPPAAAVAEPQDEADARCKCPAEPSVAAEVTVDAAADETVDAERGARAQRELPKALAARLRAALPEHRAACDVARSGPCTLHGDLDGDGVLDDVVLVRSRAGAGGIAILWGKGAAELLGGGRRGQCWTRTEVPDVDGSPGATPCATEIDADLGWLARWELRPRKLRNDVPVLVGRIGGRTVESPAKGALGDGLLLDGGDAAAVLYRTADGWTLMHLGF
ncbi:hypothetical protein [Polyangium jinanense]|uniref:Lipoprotein n=1 Tax=Polyangium jinanense TaxID=2829994 RepID=A0A9X3XEU1_9BACT|nr:hypothetical protein [Polyangium jinanense]MDC3960511.1 hypothetical protein [Polyangium jinanense]MDC3986716.1 hypothetical protein [Polyangium jinanense]